MTTENLHSLLRRQLKRHFGEGQAVPEACRSFVADVNTAYQGFDVDRSMLERSLELSSQELFQANSEMRAVLQAIPDLLFRIDRDGLIVSAKSGSVTDVVRPPSELIGRFLQDVPGDEAGQVLLAAIRRVNRDQVVVNVEYELPMGDRTQVYEARLVPAPDRQIVVIIRNISERKRLEDQLHHAQKMEAFGQLAGGVAHDFNNLLTVISGNVDLLQVVELSPAEREEVYRELESATDRAQQLTRQLLTFSRRRRIHRRSLDLNDVLGNITKMLRRLIGEHIVLETQFSATSAPVFADAGMMEQAIMNLVVNARDAMPQGGHLRVKTLTTEVSAAAAGNHPGARPGPAVCLEVSDTGSGIAPQHLAHIFEPFFTTKEIGKGTGLGLATVFGIVEQHQGWIELQTAEGRGTTFTLYFPRGPEVQEVEGQAAPARSVDAVGEECILLVEDETSVRTLMGRMLERHGYRVLVAGSGQEALRVWTQHRDKIDLLITDLVMPGGMSGRRLAELLRSDVPDLKIIYCSGYSDEVLGEDSWLRGDDSFLEKPLDWPTFLERVRQSLDEKA